MKKELKDYLHLYLGVDGKDHNGLPIKLTAINLSKILSGAIGFAPILRPLSDMADEEYDYLAENFLDDIIWSPANIHSFIELLSDKLSIGKLAEVTYYLLSKHFDLFGLIESGLAIDATLIATPTQLGFRTDTGTSLG